MLLKLILTFKYLSKNILFYTQKIMHNRFFIMLIFKVFFFFGLHVCLYLWVSHWFGFYLEPSDIFKLPSYILTYHNTEKLVEVRPYSRADYILLYLICFNVFIIYLASFFVRDGREAIPRLLVVFLWHLFIVLLYPESVNIDPSSSIFWSLLVTTDLLFVLLTIADVIKE
jgi:hypothetical protein